MVLQDFEEFMAGEAVSTALTSPLPGDWEDFPPADAAVMASFANSGLAEEQLLLQEMFHRVQEAPQQGSEAVDWRDLAIDTMFGEEPVNGEGFLQIGGGLALNGAREFPHLHGGVETEVVDVGDGDYFELNDLMGPMDGQLVSSSVHPAIQLRPRPSSSEPLVLISDVGTAHRRVLLQRLIPGPRVPPSISAFTDNVTNVPTLAPRRVSEFGASGLTSLHSQRLDVRGRDAGVAQNVSGISSCPSYFESEVSLS